jgi:hypothetical protein
LRRGLPRRRCGSGKTSGMQRSIINYVVNLRYSKRFLKMCRISSRPSVKMEKRLRNTIAV